MYFGLTKIDMAGFNKKTSDEKLLQSMAYISLGLNVLFYAFS